MEKQTKEVSIPRTKRDESILPCRSKPSKSQDRELKERKEFCLGEANQLSLKTENQKRGNHSVGFLANTV